MGRSYYDKSTDRLDLSFYANKYPFVARRLPPHDNASFAAVQVAVHELAIKMCASIHSSDAQGGVLRLNNIMDMVEDGTVGKNSHLPKQFSLTSYASKYPLVARDMTFTDDPVFNDLRQSVHELAALVCSNVRGVVDNIMFKLNNLLELFEMSLGYMRALADKESEDTPKSA